ncbi:aldehyde dehydrogenase domain-containing protein [Lineolata rhizophorae]|uniref:aldehyde dehydrogenase (NAD(+)) n=1 Tax=Lineolata rhizophorae TaxID=578093 RepID=A0A6A6P7S4_9PEZI|nr:aldehyde dehydrogenase domain-containing protein [Lineolata rhizophorae]
MSNSTDFFRFHNVINGVCREGTQTYQGVNPSTRKPLWDIPVAAAADLDDAVSAAQAAFPGWAKTGWAGRQSRLAEARKILHENRELMAGLIVEECGKPIQFASLEVQHSLDFLDFYGKVRPLEPRIVQDDADLKISVYHVPLGVVAAICPWNFPLVLAMAKISAGLLTGNCVITKPSPFTPYSIIKFTELVRDAFPAGVLQALHGDDTLGPKMCEHPGIQKISFTGSTTTGKKIMASASKTLKRVTLELGGNSASIICPDVDVNIVAPQVAMGSFFNSGQLCVASKRLFVHKDIYRPFLEAMINTVKSWKVGTANTEDVMLGPVQNEMQYNVVKQFFSDSLEKGHTFAFGGEIEPQADNFVVKPAIVDNPPDESLVVTGEAFGPIVPIQTWENEEEVIKRANNTETGLGGAVWSRDVARAERIAHSIEAGTIWINSFEKPLPQAHLAGHKQSGIGGEWGEEGLLSYCIPRTIHYYKNPVVIE